MLSDLFWRLRIRSRFALAWWAFRNPDNLTMLRHEMDSEATRAAWFDGNYSAIAEARRYHGEKCRWYLNRFLNLPVR